MTTMDADAVAQYLQENPEFFELYADVLAEIHVPHPHGGRAVSLAERQILMLREKNQQLEDKLNELVRFGAENDTIGEKLHRATLALICAPDLETTLQIVYTSLREDFGVNHVAVRFWGPAPLQSYMQEFDASSDELRNYAAALGEPYCGGQAAGETASWFAGPASLRSFAYVALRTDQAFGLLALASDDASRFHEDMGTLYLSRFGEIASLALHRFMPGV